MSNEVFGKKRPEDEHEPKPDRFLEQDRRSAEQRSAAIAYLAWPLAAFERWAPREGGSDWYAFHIRQALWFGNVAALAMLLALVWPVVLAALIANIQATLWIYGVAFLQDIALMTVWLLWALRYARRTAQGEFFTVPFLARWTGSPSPKC
ncbi:MAG: hypothetical protein ACYDHD_08400 [Vulcanimicrobiaceae bacterium]